MGSETPRVSKEGKLNVDSRGLGPPASIWTSRTAWGSGAATWPGGTGSSAKPSAGRLARPLHLMQLDKACSADAARETAFVRPHCAPRITKVHSAAACAAPAQSPSAALNGYDGTALFHHATYAASYTDRLSYVAGVARHRPDKTSPGHDERGTPGAGKGNQERDLLCL